MSLSTGISRAQGALQAADARLQASASSASNVGTQEQAGEGVKVTLAQQEGGELGSPVQRAEADPAPEVIAPILAVQAYRVNLQTLKTTDRLSGTFLESFSSG